LSQASAHGKQHAEIKEEIEAAGGRVLGVVLHRRALSFSDLTNRRNSGRLAVSTLTVDPIIPFSNLVAQRRRGLNVGHDASLRPVYSVQALDLTLLVGSLVAASVTSLRTVSAISLTEFLAMKSATVANEVAFQDVMLGMLRPESLGFV